MRKIRGLRAGDARAQPPADSPGAKPLQALVEHRVDQQVGEPYKIRMTFKMTLCDPRIIPSDADNFFKKS